MISLVIKGSFPDAIDAALRHGVTIGDLRSHHNETLATATDSQLSRVIKWYNSDMSLLLYSHHDER